MRVIRAFRQDAFEQHRFDTVNKDYTDNAVKVFSIMALMFPIMTLIMSGTNIGITWWGGHLIAQQAMQTGNLIAFITYAMQILMSFMMLSMIFVFLPRAQPVRSGFKKSWHSTPPLPSRPLRSRWLAPRRACSLTMLNSGTALPSNRRCLASTSR